MKVLFLTNMPSYYRTDFFNQLGYFCNLTVLFEKKDAKHRDSKWLSNEFKNFDAIFLDNIKYKLKINKYLSRKKYDIIIVGGYSTPIGMLSINYMNLKKIPFILNVDGGFIPKKENFIKKVIKKYYISSARYWLSTGKETTEYLINYGANFEKIFIYPFTSLLQKDLLEYPISYSAKKKLKSKLHISEEKIILSVGRFIYKKGFDVLLRACRGIPSCYGVYIVGGEPTEEYIKLKQDFNLTNVHFIGFKSKKELKQYYMASDLFVLPTRQDVWGLVINEAMAYGLPVITTNKCIAGLELIKNQENGFIVPINNAEILADKINEILGNEIILKKIAENNLKKIKKYTIENMADEHMCIFRRILSE